MRIESTFKDKVFEKLVSKENENTSKEIFKFFNDEKKYWVKKARATRSNIFQKIFYKLTSFDVLIPVENKTAHNAMLFETNKLNEFNLSGIKAAKIKGRNDSFFVLEDCGQNIYYHLKNKNVSVDEKRDALFKTIESLAKIHNSGFYHGGAQIRNFTYFKNEVYTIDLEDSFNQNIDLKTLQFRDFLLFLLSLLKLSGKYDFNIETIIFEYISRTDNRAFIKRLKKTSSQMSFLIPLGNLLKSFLSKDANAFIEFLKIVNNLEEK